MAQYTVIPRGFCGDSFWVSLSKDIDLPICLKGKIKGPDVINITLKTRASDGFTIPIALGESVDYDDRSNGNDKAQL